MDRIRLAFSGLKNNELISILFGVSLILSLTLYLTLSTSYTLFQLFGYSSNLIAQKQRDLSILTYFETNLTTTLDSVKTNYTTPIRSAIITEKLGQLCNSHFVNIQSTDVKLSTNKTNDYTISFTLSGSFNNLIKVLYNVEKYHPFIHLEDVKFYIERGGAKGLYCDVRLGVFNSYE